MAAPQLAPLASPGVTLFPGFTALKPEHFIMKAKSKHITRYFYLVSFATPAGGEGQPFLEVDMVDSKLMVFETMQGQEVMRIVKQKHSFSGRGSEYRGLGPGGRELWYLKLHRGMSTDYNLSIHSPALASAPISIQNKVMGQDKAILINGSVAAAMKEDNPWGHIHRTDHVYVAPGMDILLALGVNWIRADKQNEDAKTAAAAA